MLPVKCVDKHRIRTGYERTMAHRVGRLYAGMAEQDGKVTNIDDVAKVVEVVYEDGTKDIFEYGEKYVDFQGFFATEELKCDVTVGQKFKKGTPITYNSGYFNKDKETGQLDYSIGVKANVVMLENDTTLEDSTEISERLSDKLTIKPTNARVISLPAKSIIHKAVQVGEEVKHTDTLMIFEEEALEGTSISSGASEETLALLGDLNKKTPSAKFAGKVVRIEAYYGGSISEMSPSVASMVKDCIKQQNRAAKITKGSLREDEFPESGPLPEGSKYKGATFDKNTVVFIYYIQEEIKHRSGDKLVVFNQLKATVASVFPKPVHTESGLEVDSLFSCVSLSNRIVCAPLLYGIMSRIMEHVENEACAMYFDQK